jgi:hypothetical protein
MTLQDAKNEIARKYGYDNWASVNFYNIDCINETKESEADAASYMLDQAAELYARSKCDEVRNAKVARLFIKEERKEVGELFDEVLKSTPQEVKDNVIRQMAILDFKERLKKEIEKQMKLYSQCSTAIPTKTVLNLIDTLKP